MDKRSMLQEAVENAVKSARAIIKNLPPEEVMMKAQEGEAIIKRYLDTKLEDHPPEMKMGYALHFQTLAPDMPMSQAWITDYFVLSVGLFVHDGNTEKFFIRMENLANYIIEYRDEFKSDLGVKDGSDSS